MATKASNKKTGKKTAKKAAKKIGKKTKKKTTADDSVVASQIIPLGVTRLVLPNVAIAEIVPASAFETVNKAPKWLLGKLKWRGVTVPLVSYELTCGMKAGEITAQSRFIILNTLNGNSKISFFAIISSAIPQLVKLDANIVKMADNSNDQTTILATLEIDGEPALIPDIDAIEEMLSKHLK
ncbi:MAG: chemotaxis protein CheW [Gammaproteobacteria bacterium]|nr:MAG: chemotaxis protein CheW [Gammaproteobacteria bacterium]